MPELYYCEKCNRTMSDDNFYSSNNLEKYTKNGKLTQCKKCLTMHVDNWNPDTYLWILQEIDVPYIPDEWNKLLANYGKDKSKMTGLTILGRYLSKMKLKQYRDFRWADNEHLQEVANSKIEQTMKSQGFSAAQIDEAVRKATFTLPEGILEEPKHTDEIEQSDEYDRLTARDYFDQGVSDPLVEQLTEEDKTYLLLKWGKSYRPEEWISLEQLYNEMMESYDIQTAGDKNTLMLACKTSLKANQLLDIGDIDGAQKATKMYDALMKSGKWTAAQNKAEKDNVVDSISELVAMCERDGFIPRYYVDTPQDKVDRVIQDLQDYTRNLIVEEMHLGPLLERAVRQIEQDRENEIDDEDEDDTEALEKSLFDEPESINSDQDYADYYEHEEEVKKQNEALFKLLEEDI